MFFFFQGEQVTLSGVKQLDATPQKVLQEDGTTWQAPPRGLGLGPSPPHGCASGTLQCSLNEQAPGPNHAPANCMLAPIEYTHVPAVATSHTTHRPGASRKTMRRHTRTTGLSYTHTQGTNYFLTSHRVRSALNDRRMRRHKQIPTSTHTYTCTPHHQRSCYTVVPGQSTHTMNPRSALTSHIQAMDIHTQLNTHVHYTTKQTPAGVLLPYQTCPCRWPAVHPYTTSEPMQCRCKHYPLTTYTSGR
jgi:hypothetical protein